MNITLDQFISGFERPAANIKDTLDNINFISIDLLEIYSADISWSLSVRKEVLQVAAKKIDIMKF